jgi:predicted lipoprotein with Yx(FWY)xxD motif
VKTADKTVAGKSQSILVDSKGLTLYYFTPDKGGTVTCTAACAQNWPPLTLPSGVSSPTGDKGVTGKLATIPNPAGGTQVTYNGWPLYYFVQDKDSADTYGQGVGGKWFVVTPDVAPAT